MCKEEVVGYFKLLSKYLPGGSEEIHKNLSRSSRSLDRDFNHASP